MGTETFSIQSIPLWLHYPVTRILFFQCGIVISLHEIFVRHQNHLWQFFQKSPSQGDLPDDGMSIFHSRFDPWHSQVFLVLYSLKPLSGHGFELPTSYRFSLNQRFRSFSIYQVQNSFGHDIFRLHLVGWDEDPWFARLIWRYTAIDIYLDAAKGPKWICYPLFLGFSIFSMSYHSPLLS